MNTARTLLSTALSATLAGCALAGPETASTDETTAEAREALVTDHFNLVNPAGSCMDISGASTADGALPLVWPCSTQLNQAFKPIFYNTSEQVIVEGKEIQLVARHSGKCLDVEYGSVAPGARIIQWTCHNGDNQRWMVWALQGGKLALKSKLSGLCMVSTADGTGLIQADCDSVADANRAWSFQPTSVPPPPPDGMTVTLYRDSYSGGGILLNRDVPDLRDYGWNDIASSVTLSTGGYVSVYSDINYGGTCETLWLDTPDLSKRLIGNDTISSLRLGSYCRTALLFEHDDYQGDSMSFAGDTPDLRSSGWNDRVSSILMSPGSAMTFYRDTGYTGACDNVNFAYPELSRSHTGNDNLSSFRFGMYCQPRSLIVSNMGSLGLLVRYRIRHPGESTWSITSDTIDTGDSEGTTFFSTQDIEVDVQARDIAWGSLCKQTITLSTDQVIEVHGIPLGAYCGE